MEYDPAAVAKVQLHLKDTEFLNKIETNSEPGGKQMGIGQCHSVKKRHFCFVCSAALYLWAYFVFILQMKKQESKKLYHLFMYPGQK